jgi:hypothetical protein
LRESENSVLRRIFGPEREKVAGGWRRLHSEELQNLYSSSNIIRVIKSRRMGWEGYVARMEKERNAYKMFIGKPVGKRPSGRTKGTWKDNIRMDLMERV